MISGSEVVNIRLTYFSSASSEHVRLSESVRCLYAAFCPHIVFFGRSAAHQCSDRGTFPYNSKLWALGAQICPYISKEPCFSGSAVQKMTCLAFAALENPFIARSAANATAVGPVGCEIDEPF